jgi:ribosome-associated toxin RatA of RatAB toxin-antitoxin module
MKSVRRKERVPFSASQMFDLVNDVGAYPEFLHWCRGAKVHHASDEWVEATLEVGIGGLRKELSTRNRLERPSRIAIELLNGPFRSLEGEWGFTEADGGCEVSLRLDFEVSSMPLKFVFERLFEEIARSQVAAFIERAKEIYA